MPFQYFLLSANVFIAILHYMNTLFERAHNFILGQYMVREETSKLSLLWRRSACRVFLKINVSK